MLWIIHGLTGTCTSTEDNNDQFATSQLLRFGRRLVDVDRG